MTVGDFTKIGDIDDGGATPPPAIGDVYRDRAMMRRPAGGMVNICDVIDLDGVPHRVCVVDDFGARQWMTVADLRRRFQFRKRATA